MVKQLSRIYHRLYVKVPVQGDPEVHQSVKVLGRFETCCDGSELVFTSTIHASSFRGDYPEATSLIIKLLLDAGCSPNGDGVNFTVGIDVARSIFKTLSETFSTLTGNYDHDTFDDDMEAVVLDVLRRHVTTIHQIMLFKSFYWNTDDRRSIVQLLDPPRYRYEHAFPTSRLLSNRKEILEAVRENYSRVSVDTEILRLIPYTNARYEPSCTST